MVISQEMSLLTSAKDGAKTPKEHLREKEHTVLGEALTSQPPKAPLAALDRVKFLWAAESLENMACCTKVCKW